MDFRFRPNLLLFKNRNMSWMTNYSICSRLIINKQAVGVNYASRLLNRCVQMSIIVCSLLMSGACLLLLSIPSVGSNLQPVTTYNCNDGTI